MPFTAKNLLNASLIFAPAGKPWTVQLWGNNLGNSWTMAAPSNYYFYWLTKAEFAAGDNQVDRGVVSPPIPHYLPPAEFSRQPVWLAGAGGEDSVVDGERRLVAVTQLGVPGSGGRVLHHCHLEALLQQFAQMSLDAEVGEHSGQVVTDIYRTVAPSAFIAY